MKSSILMLSGGLDSVVLAHKLKKDGVLFDSVFFDANKICGKKELEYARYTAITTGNRFEFIDISELNKSFIGYVTSNYMMLDELDAGRSTHILNGLPGSEDPIGPSGFPILLSITSFLGQMSNREVIYTGITKEQADALSTIRQFFNDWGKTLQLLRGKAFPIKIETPFINMSKRDVINLGKTLGVDFTKSWSCVHDSTAHCGCCPRCLERKGAFSKSNVDDPTLYL